MSDKERKPKGKPERKPAGTRPGSRADDLAFEHIIEAILDADPERVREHRGKRRQKTEGPKRNGKRVEDGQEAKSKRRNS